MAPKPETMPHRAVNPLHTASDAAMTGVRPLRSPSQASGRPMVE
jgi:hypothetical protein